MNTNNLNTALYEKMTAEQDKFRDWLKSQPPEEVLNHAYEYTIREDIVMAMEELELTDTQAQALLESPSPLADTLRHFYATYLLQEGTSKQVAASLLGHADTAFLERTYCHPQDVAKQQAANLMQDLLNNQNPCYVAFMKNKNRKTKKAG